MLSGVEFKREYPENVLSRQRLSFHYDGSP